MEFANPAGLWALLLALPVLATHILRPKRTERQVSSTMLWQRMDKPVTASAPWQRLTPSWLLLLQLLAVVALAMLLANPVRVEPAALANHTVFLIDSSGSMAAVDGEPDRLAQAKARAVQVHGRLGSGGVASVIEIGPVPRVLLTTSGDADAFSEAVRRVSPNAGSADFGAAFALAEGLETPDLPIGFVLVSDGGLSDAELRLVPPGLTYEQIGSMATNRAIADLDVTTTAAGLMARVTVVNTGGPAATQPLRLDVDGRTQHETQVELAPGQRQVIEVDLPAGDRVDARLDGTDLLGIDDVRHAVTSRRAELNVTVVGAGDPFLMSMLETLDGVTLSRVDTLDADPAGAGGESGEVEDGTEAGSNTTVGARPDLYVFDRVAVPERVNAPFIAIAAPGGVTGIEVTGVVDNPVITLVRTDDSLLRDIDLSAVGIAEAQQVQVVGTDILVGAESVPLIMRGTHGGRPFVYLSFAVSQSNLPLQVGYPILGDRLVAALGGAAVPPAELVVGQRVRFPAAAATVTDPDGHSTRIEAGRFPPIAQTTGYWTIEPDAGPTQVVAVNSDPTESTLEPAPAVPSEIRTARPGAEPPSTAASYRTWIALGLFAVLIIEWLMSRRHVGVSSGQWRWATVMRLAIATALLATLFDPGWWRSADRVAVAFVVDASDSVGRNGVQESVDWIREALADQDGEGVAGVVLFGGDARIEALVQSELDLGGPAVRVDPTRTNLANALRMGGAILPGDARRRIVLISDGRATEGDVDTEVEVLTQAGIVVDVRVAQASIDLDAAVVDIDAPARVQTGEAVEVTGSVWVDQPTKALVTLVRDGLDLQAAEMDLVAGANPVGFVDADPTEGRHTYEIRVAIGNDAQPANDRAFLPVQVGDSSGVVIVEGSQGVGTGLAAALESGGLAVTVARPNVITSVDDLAIYDSIVLVDVSIDDLTPNQMAAISGSVRDAGRGLVTIGGTRSYGLGGWLGSELETVLPVVSDVLDPKRRRSIAEVLAIDTSGSMGACHCAEGAMDRARDLGGVNKTDIAKAGAARAIAALSAQDEVGVLAVDATERWVLDLQPLPDTETINDGLGSLQPNGGTDLSNTLAAAAAELRTSDRNLKHIVLFSDGFTDPAGLERLATEAAALRDEGITTSVIATGEGAAGDLRPIAEAGGGRFYPGRDLARIPEILVEETVQASRNYLVEGEFLPVVTSADSVVASLTQAPPVLGYVASTTKTTATTLLAVGEDADPLLATWRVGLGTATSWTSDGGGRWAQTWSSWAGSVDFWTRVVRDTFPTSSGSVETSARVDGDVLRIQVDSETPFAPGSAATARVATPDGSSIQVPLDRVGEQTFGAEIEIDGQGVYVVGSSVISSDPEAEPVAGTAVAARSYSAEYAHGRPDRATMVDIATATGGRELTEAAAEAGVFSAAELQAGRSWLDITRWLLLAAALAWPLAVALGRIVIRRGPEARSKPTAAEGNVALQMRNRTAPEPEPSLGGKPANGPHPEAAAAPRAVPTPPTVGPPRSQGGPQPPAGTLIGPGPAAAPTSDPGPATAADDQAGSTLDSLLAARRQRRND